MATLDEFKVIKTIGVGSTGKVKLIEDGNQNKFAAKILFQDKTHLIDLFENETELLLKLKVLNHQNIIKLVDVRKNGQYRKNEQVQTVNYFILEYCEGGSLFDYICSEKQSYICFTENIIRAFYSQIIQGLQALHGIGIYHCDLKPENILVDQNFNIKIADFGWSK